LQIKAFVDKDPITNHVVGYVMFETPVNFIYREVAELR
jgi:hypothetical protein